MSRILAFIWAAFLLVACNGGTVSQDTGPSDAGDTGPEASTALPGEWYCAANPPPMICNLPNGRNSCGVCVAPPANSMHDILQRTPCAMLTYPNTVDPAQNACDMMNPPAAPNLSCFDMATPPTQPTPMTVTIWGVVDVFGTGGDSNNINVQVFEVNPDGTPGAMVGSAMTDTTNTRVMYNEMSEVHDTSGMVTQTRLLGGFVIPNVMTDHPYIVRTQGPTDFFGHAIYDYTLPIRASHVNSPMPPAALNITGPAVYVRPRTISNSDWVTVPSTATLTSGIPQGHGAIAGEVHDCDDVRLANATVYSEPQPNFQGTVYFSDNPTMPLPDTSRSSDGTQLLSIWALLDVTPGPIRISALGYIGPSTNPTLVHLGSYQTRVFADSITITVLRGLRPWQLPH